MQKLKVLTLGDNPLLHSGVAGQCRYIIEALLKSGKFQVLSLGGAIKHQSYNPIRTQEYGEDWTILPVDNFGNQDQVRQLMKEFKPDLVWNMSDPRFYEWLWMIENEIRPYCPIIYYHVWDNYPYPKFNKKYYVSNDLIVSISKVTSDIVRTVAPEVDEIYLPHAVNPDTFKKLSEEEVRKFKDTSFNGHLKDKFVFFWNNRNARRKHSATLVWWFADFLEKYGRNKAVLLMHTDPRDEHGTDLPAILEDRGMTNGEIILSAAKLPADQMNILYNMADCTINIADAEGFGLSSLESLSAGTPVINNMTGGLQEQVTDGENVFGVAIEPASKALVGSIMVPYIREDRVSQEDFEAALLRMVEMPKQQREILGKLGQQHVDKNYNFETFQKRWVQIMLDAHEKYGSWETRKGYDRFELKEIQ